jgi:hypothetical protein
LFTNTLNLYTSLTIRHQISHPYTKTGIFLLTVHIIFGFFESMHVEDGIITLSSGTSEEKTELISNKTEDSGPLGCDAVSLA